MGSLEKVFVLKQIVCSEAALQESDQINFLFDLEETVWIVYFYRDK